MKTLNFYKKTFSHILALILISSLSACGGGSSTGSDSDSSIVTPETPIVPTVPEVPTVDNYKNANPLCEITPVSKVKIITEEEKPVISKEVYLNATLEISSNEISSTLVKTKIRGRGNSSWEAEKKPYRLKLDNKYALLGMPADKDWALLANYYDKTLLRNAVSRCLAKNLQVAWVPKSQYVEVTMNGIYDGLYELTEHVKVSKDRVNIGDESLTTPDLGYLIELDARLDGDVNFLSSHNIPYVIKSDATAQQAQMIIESINKMESALFSSDFKSVDKGYQAHLDMNSLIDYYLIQELFKNNDAFWSSTFLNRAQDEKIKFGPIWDFDIAMGNATENMVHLPDGWWIRKSIYMSRLFEDPAFEAKVKERWLVIREKLPGLLKYIDNQTIAMDNSIKNNFIRWPIFNKIGWPNFTARGSYEEELKFMKTFIIQRANYMDSQLIRAN